MLEKVGENIGGKNQYCDNYIFSMQKYASNTPIRIGVFRESNLGYIPSLKI